MTEGIVEEMIVKICMKGEKKDHDISKGAVEKEKEVGKSEKGNQNRSL